MGSDPKELMMQYGGVGGLALSILIFVAYIGLTFSDTGSSSKFEELNKLSAEVNKTLQEKMFLAEKAPKPVPNHTENVEKLWQKKQVAKKTPEHLVYPVLGINLSEGIPSVEEQEQVKAALTGRYVILDKEDRNYYGPTVKVIRDEEEGIIKPAWVQLDTVEQNNLDQVVIKWHPIANKSGNTIEDSGLEEYQLFRLTKGDEEAERLTPAGYQEETFVDTNFQPSTTYSYYVVLVAETSKLTPTENNMNPSPESPPSDSASVTTQSDVGMIFDGVIGGGGTSMVNVRVYKYHKGTWYRKNFQHRRGDKIGEPYKVKLKDGSRVELDFSTNYEVFEYFGDEDRVIDDGGKEVRIPKQARLIFLDKSGEKSERKEMWKFNRRYDENPYEQ